MKIDSVDWASRSYFELLSNLFSDGFFELLKPIRKIRFGLIVLEILVAELI